MIVEMIFLADKLLSLPLHHWIARDVTGPFQSNNDGIKTIYIAEKFAEAANGGSWQVAGVLVP